MNASRPWRAAAAIAAGFAVFTAWYVPPGFAQLSPPSAAGATFVSVTPLAGGGAVSTPVDAHGGFRLEGLSAGPHRLTVTSHKAAKQTQAVSFGERSRAAPPPSADESSTGSATTASAARNRPDTAKNTIRNVKARTAAPPSGGVSSNSPSGGPAAAAGPMKIDGGMPNRISMNVSVGRMVQPIDVDGDGIVVEVGPDGVVEGQLSAR